MPGVRSYIYPLQYVSCTRSYPRGRRAARCGTQERTLIRTRQRSKYGRAGPHSAAPQVAPGPSKLQKRYPLFVGLCATRYGFMCLWYLVGSGSYTLTANACAYHHLAAREPNVLAPLGPTRLGPPPRRTLRPLSPQRKSRGRRRRSPCTCCAAVRVRSSFPISTFVQQVPRPRQSALKLKLAPRGPK